MGRHDSSGGRWYQGNSSGAHKSRHGSGRGQQRARADESSQSGQFPIIRAQFRRQGAPEDSQPAAQPRTRRVRKRERRTGGQK